MGIVDDYYGGYENLYMHTDPDTGDVDWEGAYYADLPDDYDVAEVYEPRRQTIKTTQSVRPQQRGTQNSGVKKKKTQQQQQRRQQQQKQPAPTSAAQASTVPESGKTPTHSAKFQSSGRRLKTRTAATSKLRADAPSFVPRDGSS